ncbi:MAG TPA: PA14 domain-containing protein, partial [Polyangiaceae bacterium]
MPTITFGRHSLAWLAVSVLGACAPNRTTAGVSAGASEPIQRPVAGLVEKVPGGWLAVEVCADDIIRVSYAASPSFFGRTTLASAPKRCPHTDYKLSAGAHDKTITTSKLTVRADLSTGAVTFFDVAGHPILAERAHSLTPVTAQGESTYHVRQEWEPNEGEALYGLGQHQQGLMDITGVDLDLRQYNSEIFIPYLVSSRGYGIFWDNTSFTRFGDLEAAIPLPDAKGLYATGSDAIPGDVTNDGSQVDWSGSLLPKTSGDYLFRTYSIGDIKLWVKDQPVIDHFRQSWLAGEEIARVYLDAGQSVPVHFKWAVDGRKPIVRLLVKPPVAKRSTSLWSEVGDGIDYTFVYGPDLDRVVSGYRQLTGQAPMMPRWAFGL